MSDGAFFAQIKRTLEFEGGYANNPDDPGGETKFGISKTAYPDLDIKSLSQADAIAIYKRDYWDVLNLASLPNNIAMKVFDLAVNTGQGMAVKLLQRALTLADPQAVLLIDGVLGARTRALCRATSEQVVLPLLCGVARCHYLELADDHPTLRVFLTGWLRRANTV